jgi:hypothetical protein
VKELRISVRDKIATLENDVELVCGNSDYRIVFDFDEDWADKKIKTAVFVFGNSSIEVPFKDTVLEKEDAVAIEGANKCCIGVYSDDLITTTWAEVKCIYSIRDKAKGKKPPTKDVYNELIKLVNEIKINNINRISGIIIVEELPEEDININAFYKTKDGIYWYDDKWNFVPTMVDLDEEIERAKEVEGEIVASIQEHIKNYVEKMEALDAKDATHTKAISDEIKRAQQAEADLGKKIDNEIARQDQDIADATEIANNAKTTADTLDNTIQNAYSHSIETRDLLNSEIIRSTVQDQALSDAINEFKRNVDALLSSDTETLNDLQEIVDYIKNNKNLIDAITTNKVNVSDVVDHLLSLEVAKPLSANQGRILKELIDNFKQEYNNKVVEISNRITEDYVNLQKSVMSVSQNLEKEILRSAAKDEHFDDALGKANEQIVNTGRQASAAVETANEANGRSKEAVQQKAFNKSTYGADFDEDGDCARAYVRNRDNSEDSILISKYIKKFAIPIRNDSGNLLTSTPNSNNECTNKEYVDNKIIDAEEKIVNADYTENDDDKKSHILNRPFFVKDSVEFALSPQGAPYSFVFRDIPYYFQSWYWVGYPLDYHEYYKNWEKEFVDNIGAYKVRVEHSNNCNNVHTDAIRYYYLSNSQIKNIGGAYLITVNTDLNPNVFVLVVYDSETLNNQYVSSFSNGIYVSDILADHDGDGTMPMHTDAAKIVSLDKMQVKKIDNAFLNLQENEFIRKNILNFKTAIVKSKEFFQFTPNMIAIVFPYNNQSSIHKPSGEVLQGMSAIGTSIVFASDVKDTKYRLAVLSVKGLATTSNQDEHPVTDSGYGCYLVNDYIPSSEETGYTYVYYIEKG